MKVFYITTRDPTLQGDLLECVVFRGLRELLKEDFIDIPKKKVMYGDFSESPKLELHTRGFTLFDPFLDIADRNILPEKKDVLIYGVVPETYGVKRDYELESKVGLVVFLDGHDHPEFRHYCLNEEDKLYFKRELRIDPKFNLYPIQFGVPESYIKDIDFTKKNKLYPKTVPKKIWDNNLIEYGRAHHIFTKEEDYVDDLVSSWFAITCEKGGWGQLRDLEGLANGCLVLYKDFDKKPKYCAPQDAPYISFSTIEEMEDIMNRLVVNNEPTKEYLRILGEQRNALFSNFTCETIALKLINKIKSKLNNSRTH